MASLVYIIYAFHPVLEPLKRLSASNIIDQNDRFGSIKVASRQRVEALLSCRVPDLQLDDRVFDAIVNVYKVDSDRWNGMIRETLIVEPFYDWGFSLNRPNRLSQFIGIQLRLISFQNEFYQLVPHKYHVARKFY